MLGGDHSLLIVNVFSKGAWWRFPHDPAADAEKIQACRRAEENLVSRLSGCPHVNLDFAEALLRGHAMADLFTATPGGRDADVSDRIRDAVASLACEHPLVHWFLPLGVGDHIDHRIVRDAALAALHEAGLKPTHLHFYEDLPYAAKGRQGDFATKVSGVRLAEDSLGVEESLPWKLELLRAYWSQFRWNDLLELKHYAKSTGGGEAVEITWSPVPA
jgi:LmbE family N-acetylglucosaminyl deacetylase